jgi:predicted Zn finger-like uncharacterized protein
MSLVTACPACGVLFKVAPDQLLISEGWVRCGKCQTVFDASLNLQPHLKASKAVSPVETKLVSSQPLEVAAQEQPSEKILAAEGSLNSSNDRPLEPPVPVINPVPDITASDEPHTFQFASGVPASEQNRPSTGRRSWVRKVLYLLTPLLLLMFIGQVVLFERNEIFSREPKSKPWLIALCKPFDCQLETLKRIQSIVIDSSTFTKISPDIYQLALILKNTSTADLHLPAVELTLINSLDQPLLRRVFSVDELRIQSNTLLSLSELPISFSFAIKSGELSDRVTGFRVLVFYP